MNLRFPAGNGFRRRRKGHLLTRPLKRGVDPRVEFKYWMAEGVPQRPELKRRRDRRQAAIVQTLLDEGLLVSQAGIPRHP